MKHFNIFYLLQIYIISGLKKLTNYKIFVEKDDFYVKFLAIGHIIIPISSTCRKP